MDRRTWVQLLGVLSAAGLSAQDRPAAPPAAATPSPGAAPQQPPQRRPLRVTKEQVTAALALIGLQFEDSEIEMMLPQVSSALTSFEELRKVEVPYDVEPAFTFHPGLPGRTPGRGPARYSTTIPPAAAAAPKAPKDLEELAFLPVTELAPLLRARAITSTDLTKMYLARMKRYAPDLLCLVTLTDDLALERAAEADKEIRAGRYRGPLHGIPFGVKDLFDTKGILTAWGAEPFRKRVPDRDATVIERLHAAGAVLMAKLSMGALAMGDLWDQGQTKSPWSWSEASKSYARGSSGSSAGPASATSAGLVAFALGTETLGSIVSPSIQCGTAGLRPTYGRVSRYGAMALSWTMDKIGPICRGVEDCALVLHAIHGPDGRDRSVAADPFHWEPRRPLAEMRIAVLQKAFDNVRGGDKPLYDQALADLKRAGVKMTAVDFDENLPAIRFMLNAEGAAAFDDITRDGEVRTLRGQTPGSWPNTFRGSRLVPAVEYIRAQRARTQVIQRFEKFMADWDVLVILPQTLLTTTNLTGNPQVVMKCGFAEDSLQDGSKIKYPRSISFLGKIYEEGAPLRVALAYERATAWGKMHPVLGG
jgi:Asp-tRNA(Asn)/Glu-tRNA(Gln) amidotransferase A subunit family amidase